MSDFGDLVGLALKSSAGFNSLHLVNAHARASPIGLRQLRCLDYCSNCYGVERTGSHVGFTPTMDQRLSRRRIASRFFIRDAF
jgi:hypothetical protein